MPESYTMNKPWNNVSQVTCIRTIKCSVDYAVKFFNSISAHLHTYYSRVPKKCRFSVGRGRRAVEGGGGGRVCFMLYMRSGEGNKRVIVTNLSHLNILWIFLYNIKTKGKVGKDFQEGVLMFIAIDSL